MSSRLHPRNTTRRAPARIAAFQRTVLAHYRSNGRHDLPWRKTHDPYRIMVSEVMLQQTQVPRVIEKYKAFLKAFPDVHALAGAPLAHVLKEWSGLGYNRRAKFLHEAAKRVVRDHKGRMPKTADELEQLPGIGPYTARAIAAFAYDAPSVFIETNIRAAFIHHFFPDALTVHDRELLPLIEAAASGQEPRSWYAALMDYGSYLKQTSGNASRRSAHHIVQKQFKGSLREARGQIIKILADRQLTGSLIAKETKLEPERVAVALSGLEKDGMIVQKENQWQIA